MYQPPEIDPGVRWNREPVILVVDDEPAVLSAVRRILRNEPYEVITAASCEEALAWLDELRVDLVITDQSMPGMSGTELLDLVRKRSPKTARALLTGRPAPPAWRPGAEGGTDPVLLKAWDEERLVEAVRRLVNRSVHEIADRLVKGG